MKKLISLTLTLALALCALAVPAMAEEAPVWKEGILSMLNMSEEEAANFVTAQLLLAAQMRKEGYTTEDGSRPENADDANYEWTLPKIEMVPYDSLDAMLMALNAGDIMAMLVYQSTAHYLMRSIPGLYVPVDYSYGANSGNAFARTALSEFLTNDFAFMFMQDKAGLRDEFNTAISAIREDGTLDKLAEIYIDGVNAGNEPEAIAMPAIEDAETVKVAVTGCLPPMDYVAPDGTPAGYNTAVLAEISTRMNKNIELVQVDSLGRAAALVAGAVDAVFWTRTNHASNEWAEMSAEERATDYQSLAEEMSEEEAATHEQFHQLIDFESYGKMDMPEGTIISDSYYSDVFVPIWIRERVKRED